MGTAKRLLLILIVIGLTVMPVGCAADPATDTASDEESQAVDEPTGSDTQPADGETPPELAFELVSPAYEDGEAIPVAHARSAGDGGQNESIPLAWSAAPEGVGSFALVMVDRHPIAQEWIHWMVVDISPDSDGLEIGASGDSMPAGARELQTSWGTAGYEGPEPPPGSGAHDYEITVYALNTPTLDIADDADFEEFLQAVRTAMLGAATMTGTYER